MPRVFILVVGLLPTLLSAKVVFLVLEGLTENLMEHIPTPALDGVASNGVVFPLKPEFPAESLPTFQAMMTGQHTEMTGVQGSEVYSNGLKLTPKDFEFWLYNSNISTIAVSV